MRTTGMSLVTLLTAVVDEKGPHKNLTSNSLALTVTTRASKWGSNDRINWTEAGGSLFSDNDQGKLSWSSDRVEILKPVGHNVNATGFKIRGTRPLLPGGSDVFDNNGDIFRVKHVNNEADYIEYLGQIKDTACLVNKGYVDDAISNATGSALVDVRTNNPSNPDIGHMWYNKSTNQLLLRIS